MNIIEAQIQSQRGRLPDSPQFPRALFGREIDALMEIYQSVGLREEQAWRAALADLQADFGYVVLAAA